MPGMVNSIASAGNAGLLRKKGSAEFMAIKYCFALAFLAELLNK